LSFQIVFALVLNDMMFNTSFLYGDASNYGEESSMCQFQAFSVNYFLVCSIMWSCSASYLIDIVVSQSLQTSQNRHDGFSPTILRRKMFVVCQLLPIIPSVMPMWFKAYGSSGVGWCWIKKGKGPNSEYEYIRLFSVYFWNWLAIFYCVCNYWKVSRAMRKLRENVDHHWRNDSPWKVLQLYPFILIFCSIFATVDRFIGVFHQSPYWLKMMHAATQLTLGFWDSLLFLCNPIVLKEFRRKISEWGWVSDRSKTMILSASLMQDSAVDGKSMSISHRDSDLTVHSHHLMSVDEMGLRKLSLLRQDSHIVKTDEKQEDA